MCGHHEGDTSLHPKSEELGLQMHCNGLQGTGLWGRANGAGTLKYGLSPSSGTQHANIPDFQEAWDCLMDYLGLAVLGLSLQKEAIRLCIRDKQK